MITQNISSSPTGVMDRWAWLERISEAKDAGNTQQVNDLWWQYPLLAHQLEVHIDYENIFFSLKQLGRRFFAEDVIKAIEKSLRTSGEIVSGTAYADWGRINRDCRCDIQRIFEEQGIQTRYTLTGKNSADMALANNVRDSLETGFPKTDTVVIASGDRDFLPLANTIKQRGKQLIILACSHSLSNALQGCANEVVLLDNYLKSRNPNYSI